MKELLTSDGEAVGTIWPYTYGGPIHIAICFEVFGWLVRATLLEGVLLGWTLTVQYCNGKTTTS